MNFFSFFFFFPLHSILSKSENSANVSLK